MPQVRILSLGPFRVFITDSPLRNNQLGGPPRDLRVGKEKQGRRSMWRCLCRHMTLRPCFDVVRVTGFEPAASWSQTTRATSCATPGCRQKKLAPFRFRGLRKSRESCISAPSFFLSESNPLRWASIRVTGEKKLAPFRKFLSLTKALYTSFYRDARETSQFFFRLCLMIDVFSFLWYPVHLGV